MKLALDTNAYSELARDPSGRSEMIRSAKHLYMPLFVLGELRGGFARGSRTRTNEAALEQFLSSPLVSVLLPDDEKTRHYAKHYRNLRAKGVPIPTNDIWIAALATQHRLTLCTSDRHFSHLPEVVTC